MKRRVVLACSLILLAVLQGFLTVSAHEDGLAVWVTGAGRFQLPNGRPPPKVQARQRPGGRRVRERSFRP